MFSRSSVTILPRAYVVRCAARVLGTLLLTACASDLPVQEPAVAGKFENACLPEALVLKDALLKANIESKVLIIHSTNWNHAALVYLYPHEKSKVWVWDSTSKSRSVNASYDNPLQIARAWLSDQSTNAEVVRAEFL